MHHCQYPLRTYFKAFFFNVREHTAKCRFTNSCVIIACAPGNVQSRALPAEYDITYIQGLLCAEDDLLQEHRIVGYYEQEEIASGCIYDWAEIISEPYDSGRKSHPKQNDAILHTVEFRSNVLQETLKDVSLCIRI